MRVKRVGYVGLRTTKLEPTHSFDLLEVYGPGHSDEQMIPDDVDFMVAFRRRGSRGDARRRARADGLEMVRAPDGRVCAIEQVPGG